MNVGKATATKNVVMVADDDAGLGTISSNEEVIDTLLLQ